MSIESYGTRQCTTTPENMKGCKDCSKCWEIVKYVADIPAKILIMNQEIEKLKTEKDEIRELKNRVEALEKEVAIFKGLVLPKMQQVDDCETWTTGK